MININQEKTNLALIIFFFVFINLFFLHSIDGPDLWFHLQIGQENLINKTISQADFHSFTAEGQKYINQSWLAQIVFFSIYKILGIFGLQLFHSVILFSIFILLFLSSKSSKTPTSLIALIFLLPLAFIHDQIRPFIFTWFFSSLIIFLLSKKKYYPLPIVFLLWVNLHAGFLLGLGVIFFYLLIESISSKKIEPLLFFLLSFIATLINPSGIKVYSYPFSINDSIKLLSISEWQPFEVGTIYFWIYLIFILTIIVLSIKQKVYRTNLLEFIFIICFSLFGFTSMRQSAPIVIFLFPLFVKYTSKALSSLKKIFIPIISCLVLLILFFSLKIPQRLDNGLGVDNLILPVYGIDFIKEHQITGNIFNDITYGGIMIFKQPEKKIFIDGRLEIYQGKPVKEYGIVSVGAFGWQQILEKYNIDCIFIERNSLNLNKTLINNPQWDLVYFDTTSVIYLKKGTYLNVPRLKYINPYDFNLPTNIDPFIEEYKYLTIKNPRFYQGYGILASSYIQKKDYLIAKYYLTKFLDIAPDKSDPEIKRMKNLLNIK